MSSEERSAENLQDAQERARAQTPAPAVEGTVPEWDIVFVIEAKATIKMPFDTEHFGGATMYDVFRDMENMPNGEVFRMLDEHFSVTPEGGPTASLTWSATQARHEPKPKGGLAPDDDQSAAPDGAAGDVEDLDAGNRTTLDTVITEYGHTRESLAALPDDNQPTQWGPWGSQGRQGN